MKSMLVTIERAKQELWYDMRLLKLSSAAQLANISAARDAASVDMRQLFGLRPRMEVLDRLRIVDSLYEDAAEVESERMFCPTSTMMTRICPLRRS